MILTDYKERLIQLNLLPVALDVRRNMKDLLFFFRCVVGMNFNISHKIKLKIYKFVYTIINKQYSDVDVNVQLDVSDLTAQGPAPGYQKNLWAN